MPIRVMGADLSMNHGAVVMLEDGMLADVQYYTKIAGSAAKSPAGTRWKVPKTKDKHVIQMERLAFFHKWFDEVALTSNKPDYLGIEDYALDAGRNAQHTGEVGGTARMLAWVKGIKFRLHDPMSVKMFGAHHGHADKKMIEESVLRRWGEKFDQYNVAPSKKGKENRQTSEDICDAFIIAQMVWTELQLRRGVMQLSEMHEQEIRVFNRITKFMPMNLLDRDWIAKTEQS
jgi:Holliday junction resolvasome RuvABC endonuclease subunit